MEKPQYDEYKKIEILSTDDIKLKLLGELFSSETGRTILNLIIEHEITASTLAVKTGFSLELIRYHLQKMLEMGFVKISKIEKNSREQDMKFYVATNFVIMVFPPHIKQRAKESKSLTNSILRLYKFMSIGAISVSVWLVSFLMFNTPTEYKIPRPLQESMPESFFLATMLSLTVIIIGLVIERIKKK